MGCPCFNTWCQTAAAPDRGSGRDGGGGALGHLCAFYAEAVVNRDTCRKELRETMGTAIDMGAGPSMAYAARALEAIDQFQRWGRAFAS
jgi:hypothetical protein